MKVVKMIGIIGEIITISYFIIFAAR